MKVILPNGTTTDADAFSYAEDVLTLTRGNQPQPEPEPEPEPDPQPEPDPIPGVIEHYAFDAAKGSSNVQILVNPTDTIASKFTGPAKGYGEIKFEFDPTIAGGYKKVRAWISTTPGGAAIDKSTQESAMMLSVNWTTAPDHRTKASLGPGQTYYLNLKQIDVSEHGSRLFRFVNPGPTV